MNVKYLEISKRLVELAERGRDGDLLPSESELCETFGVSHITARKAFSELEAMGVVCRKKGKGSYIRKIACGKAVPVVFLVLPMKLQIHDDILCGILSQSRESNVRLSVYHYDGDGYGLMREVEASRPDGVLWIGPESKELATIEKLRLENFHVMVLNRIPKQSHLNYVSLDHEMGAAALAAHFVKAGHKRLAFIGYDPQSAYSESRYQGFVKAIGRLASVGVSVRAVPVCCRDYAPGVLVEGVRELLSRFSPTALLCSQGAFLGDTLMAIKAEGLAIPGQVELATYDAIPFDVPEKGFIHEIVQPWREMGRAALQALDAMVKGGRCGVRRVFQPEIKIRIFKRADGI